MYTEIKKTKTVSVGILLLIMLFTFSSLKNREADSSTKYVIIGYVGGFRGLVNTEMIKAKKLTHINYAFVDVQHNRAWLTNEATDTINFRKLNLLKLDNPDLKILISIGGWSWSENFSDAVLTDTSRKAFATSAAEIVRKYGLDGVDIDWEYPAKPGEEGNIYRPEDRHNFTLMFQEIRNQLDKLEHEMGKKMLLTTAVGGSPSFVEHTEMDKVQQYVDYINLMTYDFGGDTIALHHTNLYPTSTYPNENSVDKTVTTYIAAGVPAKKLVVGVAFYGHMYKMSSSEGEGLKQRVVSRERGESGYSFIKDSLINKNRYKRYWDQKAMAPYLFNKEKKLFISYDDEQSVKEKCNYVKSHHLVGAFFWEYASDPKGYLLDTINESLDKIN